MLKKITQCPFKIKENIPNYSIKNETISSDYSVPNTKDPSLKDHPNPISGGNNKFNVGFDEMFSGTSIPSLSMGFSANNIPNIPYLEGNIDEIPRISNINHFWLYLDPQNNIQGPFPSSEMRTWLEAGYFKINLPVKLDHWSKFYPLGLIYPTPDSAFLYNLPDEPILAKENDKDKVQYLKTTELPRISNDNSSSHFEHPTTKYSETIPTSKQVSSSSIMRPESQLSSSQSTKEPLLEFEKNISAVSSSDLTNNDEKDSKSKSNQVKIN